MYEVRSVNSAIYVISRICLFDLQFNVPVYNYGHVEMVC